jgi:hypothetical protein
MEPATPCQCAHEDVAKVYCPANIVERPVECSDASLLLLDLRPSTLVKMDYTQQHRVPPKQPQYSYNDSHYGQAYNPNTEMGKQQFESLESPMPALEHQKSSGSFRSHVQTHDDVPTEAEMALLRKLRTLNGADYEAQYFDNKPSPNHSSQYGKMGNPTAL